MRVLVTGSEGFIGKHLMRELGLYGHVVIGVDRARNGPDIAVHAHEIIADTQPDVVIHLAARYGRLLCAEEPEKAIHDNVLATERIADACYQGASHLIYASTSEVYGDHGKGVITEDSQLLMPTTIYGLSKRWGEEVCKLYLNALQSPSSDIKLTIVRMNMIYGPEQQSGHGRAAIATFIDNALLNRSFTVHQGATRSWLYVADATRALRLLAERGLAGVFNLSNNHEYLTVEEQARMVVELVERDESIIDLQPPPAGQIPHKMYSSAKLEEEIEWKPHVDFLNGLRRQISYRRSKGAAE